MTLRNANMKNIFPVIVITFLALSCSQQQATKNRVQYDSLVSVINERDESITDFVTSFNEVERNLDSITIKQKVISLNSNKSVEFTPTQKTRINNEIKSINKLMNKNRLKLEDITNKFNASSTKNSALQTTIKTITNQLAQKQKDLVALNRELLSLNAQVEELETSVDFLIRENGVQSDVIEYSILKLRTAYYVIGKTNLLLDDKIIDKKGGLLGAGRTMEISTEINNNNFTKIDYLEKTSFPIHATGVKIITSHPLKSYMLETDINDADLVHSIVITNPALFWSVSKYLVVATK